MKHLMYGKATIPRFETTARKTDVRNIYQGAVLGLVNSQVCLAAKPFFSEAALKPPRREVSSSSRGSAARAWSIFY